MTTVNRESPVRAIERIFSKPKNLLLVDDDEHWAEIFRTRCSKYNLDITVANRCSLARLELKEHPFDAIALDVRLTNGNGVELYRDVAAISPATQVIFLTGYATEDVRKQVQQIGPARVYDKDCMKDEAFIEQLMAQIGAVKIGTTEPFLQ